LINHVVYTLSVGSPIDYFPYWIIRVPVGAREGEVRTNGVDCGLSGKSDLKYDRVMLCTPTIFRASTFDWVSWEIQLMGVPEQVTLVNAVTTVGLFESLNRTSKVGRSVAVRFTGAAHANFIVVLTGPVFTTCEYTGADNNKNKEVQTTFFIRLQLLVRR
jgi:hypothetical protein